MTTQIVLGFKSKGGTTLCDWFAGTFFLERFTPVSMSHKALVNFTKENLAMVT